MYKTWKQKTNKRKRHHWIGHLGAQTAIGLDGIRPQEDLCFYLLSTGWKWEPKIEAHTHTNTHANPQKTTTTKKKKSCHNMDTRRHGTGMAYTLPQVQTWFISSFVLEFH